MGCPYRSEVHLLEATLREERILWVHGELEVGSPKLRLSWQDNF